MGAHPLTLSRDGTRGTELHQVFREPKSVVAIFCNPREQYTISRPVSWLDRSTGKPETLRYRQTQPARMPRSSLIL